LIPETASLLSLILSLRIWQASQRGRWRSGGRTIPVLQAQLSILEGL
jgi:hypothetical protein